MKKFFFGFLAVCTVAILALPSFSQSAKGKKEAEAKPPVVIAAAATSYGEGSSSVVCLLDENCKGFWTPMSKDGGVNEGIYIQFKEPAVVNGIDIVVEGNVAGGVTLKPYFDGMTGSDPATQKLRKAKAAREDAVREKERRAAQREIDKPGYDGSGDLPHESDAWGNVDGDQLRAYPYEDRKTGVTHFAISHWQADYKVKSLFFKIDAVRGSEPPKILSIRFYDKTEFFEANEKQGLTAITARVQPIVLPAAVKAKVAASSILSPEIAYGPEHLFDSQSDMAWSIDGRKSNGIGESVTISLTGSQKIQGLMLWNGYQRSEAHFRANGRVRILDVNGIRAPVQDIAGMQTIKLPRPLETDHISLTVKDTYKGSSYKDVLISELRFLTPDGRVVLPQVDEKSVALPEWAAPLQDATYASFVQTAVIGNDAYYGSNTRCSNTALRVRSNGSFVIYSDFLDGKKNAESYEPGVIEGNWETGQEAKTLRIFGKKYRVPVAEESGYLTMSKTTTELPGPRIFQSLVKVVRFNDMSEAEQRSTLAFVVGRRLEKGADAGKNLKAAIILNLNDEAMGLTYNNNGALDQWDNLDAALVAALTEVKKLNPLFIKSDVYTDLLLRQDQVRKCSY